MDLSLGLGLVPLAWAIFTIAGALFCYFYSVTVGHVYPLVPSISNTGTKRPEGDIFAETMNVSSFRLSRYHADTVFSTQVQSRNIL